jgi:hypothetical protein
MQISGRLAIMAMFVLALAMAGGAWLYQYNYSRQSAAFWGESSRLIGKSPELQLLLLEPAPREGTAAANAALANQVAGRNVADFHDLRNKQGLIHLRHIFIQDDNFLWDARSRESFDADRDWAYALRFVEGSSEQIVLLRRDFQLLGKVSADGQQVDVLPCPRIAGPLERYLRDVGALQPSPAAAEPAPVEPAAR